MTATANCVINGIKLRHTNEYIHIYLLIPYIQKYSLTVLAGPIKRIMSSNSPAKIKCWKLSLEWVYDIWWSPICMTLNQYTRRIRNQILRIRQTSEFQSSINTRGVYAIKTWRIRRVGQLANCSLCELTAVAFGYSKNTRRSEEMDEEGGQAGEECRQLTLGALSIYPWRNAH